MSAPELSEDERRIVERFEAAPDLPESWAVRSTTPHDETCARCDRRICVCPCQCARCVPAADCQTDEATQDDGWPVRECDHEGGECHDIAHQTDPAARPAHADAVMADLGAAITEGVTEVRLREVVVRLYAWLGDRTSRPDGSEWDHGSLRVAARDLLAVVREVTS